jgi:hypothetical protein
MKFIKNLFYRSYLQFRTILRVYPSFWIQFFKVITFRKTLILDESELPNAPIYNWLMGWLGSIFLFILLLVYATAIPIFFSIFFMSLVWLLTLFQTDINWLFSYLSYFIILVLILGHTIGVKDFIDDRESKDFIIK